MEAWAIEHPYLAWAAVLWVGYFWSGFSLVRVNRVTAHGDATFGKSGDKE